MKPRSPKPSGSAALVERDTFDWDRLKKECGGEVMQLSFSCGKDSPAVWLTLKEHGYKVNPYYMYLVPDLEFVEHSLRYYEDFFGTHILRRAHPNFYRQLHDDYYQQPNRVGVIENLRLPLFWYDDVADAKLRRTNNTPDVWQAVATRKAESDHAGTA